MLIDAYLTNRRPNLHSWIKGGVGVLEHHLHVPCDCHGAGCGLAQPRNQVEQRGLARAGAAHDGKALAFAHGEGDVVYRHGGAALQRDTIQFDDRLAERDRGSGRAGLGCGGECFGVVGVASDDAPVLKHQHPVGHAAHHGQVVGDEQQAHATLADEAVEQVEDVGLDDGVEGGGGLVANEHVRVLG